MRIDRRKLRKGGKHRGKDEGMDLKELNEMKRIQKGDE